MNERSNSIDLHAAIERAKAEGAVRIDSEDGEFYVVATRSHGASAPAPFNDAERLLVQPTKRSAYSDRTAWLMSVLSDLAYMPFEHDPEARRSLQRTLADGGFVLQAHFDNQDTGTQAFLARRPGAFSVLAFRGTEKDRRDILADLDARFYSTPEGLVHRGFATTYESVKDGIVATLKDLDDTEPLFITGHSLGGALATVAAVDLERHNQVAACYTFGSPRVGVAEWADSVKAPVYRVVNAADGVPLVPGGAVFRWVLLQLPNLPFLAWLEKPIRRMISRGFVGFQHVGDYRFLMGTIEGATLKIGSAASWARFRHVALGRFLDAVSRLKPNTLSPLLSDHSIVQYTGKLRTIAINRLDKPRPLQ